MGHNRAEVYLHTVALARVTSQPQDGLYELCRAVGRQALEDLSPLAIDSFYVASMEAGHRGGSQSFTARLAADLGVLPMEPLGPRQLSSACGAGYIPAYKDVASGLHETSMVIAFQRTAADSSRQPAGPTTRQVARPRPRARCDMLPPQERVYGLEPVLLADLLERALCTYLGLSETQMQATIAETTMAMLRRARSYPFAQQFGNTLSRAQYEASPRLSQFYRADDVPRSSCGACALVFSCRPPRQPLNDRVVRLRAIGQGAQPPSLTDRFGPITLAPAIRCALLSLMRQADITPQELRSVHLGFPHDAYPSVARLVLKELGLTHPQSLRGLLQGRFNPCGGMLGCGHPVGCSGELQIARAYQQMTGDACAIPGALQHWPAHSALVVTVGPTLANVVATFLEAEDAGRPTPARATYARQDRTLQDEVVHQADIFRAYDDAMQAVPRDAAVVLTNTRGGDGWINLLQLNGSKSYALSEDQLQLGALVELRRVGQRNEVARVLDPQVSARPLASFGIIARDGRQCARQPQPVSQATVARQ